MGKLKIFLVAALLLLTGFGIFRYQKTQSLTKPALFSGGYDLMRPTSIHILPDVLHEISGITYIGNNRIATQHDEAGRIYIYDLVSRNIIETLSFSEPGDYEDIAVTPNGIYYLLRSDGVLIEFEPNINSIDRYMLATGAKNNEGLTYDSATNSLLIATKSKAGKGAAAKDERFIYSFDLKSKQLKEEPVLVINMKSLQQYFKNVQDIKFRPSAIAVHPTTGSIYIVSAADHSIAVFEKNGTILEAQLLNADLFNQPEGMTFMDTGDLFIANEGGDTKPTLLHLSPSQQ